MQALLKKSVVQQVCAQKDQFLENIFWLGKEIRATDLSTN